MFRRSDEGERRHGRVYTPPSVSNSCQPGVTFVGSGPLMPNAAELYDHDFLLGRGRIKSARGRRAEQRRESSLARPSGTIIEISASDEGEGRHGACMFGTRLPVNAQVRRVILKSSQPGVKFTLQDVIRVPGCLDRDRSCKLVPRREPHSCRRESKRGVETKEEADDARLRPRRGLPALDAGAGEAPAQGSPASHEFSARLGERCRGDRELGQITVASCGAASQRSSSIS